MTIVKVYEILLLVVLAQECVMS